ncbi:VirB4-like conjugal transfer ATPase, CD1110 family [Dubosiella newyorkensis]|uniref:VirB4-like conjugal transfer ATPase, CD1110 family n=3 Tax=Dubosiella TaxID=1937008 RepID=UPI00272C8EBF|nr:DUF87 domain-containing protein [Dubosiella newyorkensis]
MFRQRKKEVIEKSTDNMPENVASGANKKLTRKEKKKELVRIRSVQNAFGYEQMLKNGICVLDDDLYSSTIQFTDTNFAMAPKDGKVEIFTHYMEILNALATDKAGISLTINNRLSDEQMFKKKMIMPYCGDGLDDLRQELNQQRLDDLARGNNKIVTDKMMTITVKADNILDAKRELDKAAYDLDGSFRALGADCEVLNGKKRLETIYSVVKPGKELNFDYANLSVGDSTKDFIAPYAMDFGEDASYFRMDDRYCRVLYLSSWATEMTEAFFENLISLEHNVMVTLHMSVVPRGEDIKHIQRQIDDMRANRSKIIRRDRREGGDGDVPDQIEFEYEQAMELLQDVQQRNQRLFTVQLLVFVNAPTKDEMEFITKDVQSEASKRGFEFLPMTYEQEDGFSAVLPIGQPKKNLGRKTVSKVCAIMVPFTTKEIRAKDKPIYYGSNPISRNMILANRRELANPSGWILGKPGFGKSMTAKQEAMAVLLQDPDADVFFIDPQGEYRHMAEELNKISAREKFTVLKVDTTSNMHFNPFEVDMTDQEWRKRKAEFLLFVIAEMIGQGDLSAAQKSRIDRIISTVYLEYTQAYEMDPHVRQPTLKDFYIKLNEFAQAHQDPIAADIAESLWIYVNGSIDLFAQESNVDMSSRFIVFDISELGDSIRTLSMKVILETLEQRIRVNNILKKPTYVYIDEIYLLLKDAYSEQFLNEFWKWCRKFGGVVTGITQNVSELLASTQATSLLSNSEFCLMLAQGQADLVALQQLFNLSDEQVRSLLSAGIGTGLIKYGSTIIPFKNVFPKNTKLYEIWNTDPKEKIRIEKEKQKQLQEKVKQREKIKEQKIEELRKEAAALHVEKIDPVGEDRVVEVQPPKTQKIPYYQQEEIKAPVQIQPAAFDPDEY